MFYAKRDSLFNQKILIFIVFFRIAKILLTTIEKLFMKKKQYLIDEIFLIKIFLIEVKDVKSLD